MLVATCLNDITELALQPRPPPPLLQALHRRSALVRRVVDAAHRELAQVEDLFASQPDLAAYYAELRGLRHEVEQDGAAFTVAVLPYRFQFEPGVLPRASKEITAWCAAESLRCLDLRPALAPLGPAAFVDENHLSREGSAAVAAALRVLLPRRSMVEPLDDALADARTPGGEAARHWLTASRPGLAAGTGAPCAGRSWPRSARRPPARAPVRHGRSARCSRKGAEAALRTALADRSDAVAATAARALRARGDSSTTTDALLRALAHRAAAVRWAAADALATRAVRLEWLPTLRGALATPDGYVRNFAAFAVGRLGAADEGSRASWCGWWPRPATTTRPGSPTRSPICVRRATRRCPGSSARCGGGEPAERAAARERSASCRHTRRFTPWPARSSTTRPPCAGRRRSRSRASARPAMRCPPCAGRYATPILGPRGGGARARAARGARPRADRRAARRTLRRRRRRAAARGARAGPRRPGEPQVRAALVRATADADERVRAEAWQSLARLTSPAPR